MAHITTIILAAGTSSRYGIQNKLLALIDDLPLLAHVLQRAAEAGLTDLLVVTGHDAEVVTAVAMAENARTVHNTGFGQGLGSSLATGVEASPEADGWLIWPADLPFVKTTTVRQIVHAFDVERPIVPTINGRRGHPVLFPASFRDGLLALSGETGGRKLLSSAIELSVNDEGIRADIDHPSDWNRHAAS